MFVGHYGVSFFSKKAQASIPLWVLFLAVQLLDVLWAPLVLLGVERVRIVPGFTATNPLDLYYMPYTHSLVAALVWSAAAGAAYHAFFHPRGGGASLVVGLAVFSHWVLDFVVHVPDLPLYDNTAKVGLGLWNNRLIAFSLESGLLLAGLVLYLRNRSAAPGLLFLFSFVMLGVQAYIFFGPPPASGASIAGTALGAYGLFAAIAWVLADRRRAPGAA